MRPEEMPTATPLYLTSISAIQPESLQINIFTQQLVLVLLMLTM